MNRTARIFSAIAVAGTIAAAGSAFTSSNTVAASSASSGTTAISAYTTSNVQYGANATDPQVLDSVTFTLSATARYVAIRTKAAGTWYRSDDLRLTTGTVDSCTSANDTTWTCNVTGTGETVLAADNLSVVATT